MHYLIFFIPLNVLFCKEYTLTRDFFCDDCLDKNLKNFKTEQIDLTSYFLLHLDSCYSICDYDKEIRKIIIELKFRDKKNNSLCLTQLLNEKTGNFFKNIDFVLPVPLNDNRFKERGFNQTELIFKPWAEKENFVWLDILKRVRNTKPQWQLNSNERKGNLKNAFAVKENIDKNILKNKTLLLVDDIFTSGHTMQECAKIIKKAGALKVIGFSISRTNKI